jgi:hypothetical protein
VAAHQLAHEGLALNAAQQVVFFLCQHASFLSGLQI